MQVYDFKTMTVGSVC